MIIAIAAQEAIMRVGSKLLVKVVRATNLMGKDGQGSSSAYVQVIFDGQRKMTRSIMRDCNPVWDETMEFPITQYTDLATEVLEIEVIDNSKKPSGKKNKSLGRIWLHGSTIAKKGQEQLVYYKLDKKGLFSLVRGELGLIVCYIDEMGDVNAPTQEPDEGYLRRAPPKAVMTAQYHAPIAVEDHPGQVSSAKKLANSEIEAVRIKRTAENEQRGRSTLDVSDMAHKGQTTEQRVFTRHNENGESTLQKEPYASKVMADVRGSREALDERAVLKSTGRKRKTASSNTGRRKVTTNDAVSSELQQNESLSQPSTSHESLTAPPIRRPPIVRFDVPPRQSVLETAENIGDLHTSDSTSIKHDMRTVKSATTEGPSPVAHLPTNVELQASGKEASLEALPHSSCKTPMTTVRTKKFATAASASAIRREVRHTSQLGGQQEPRVHGEADKEMSGSTSTSAFTDCGAEDMQPAVGDPLQRLANDRDVLKNKAEDGLNPNRADAVENAEAHDTVVDATATDLDVEITDDSDSIHRMPYVFVKVVKARSLIAMADQVKPNTYACILLGNQHVKSKVVPNTLYPEYDQIFAFDSDIETSTLEVSLWDHNPPLQDAFLGAVFFNMPDIPKRTTDFPLTEQWYTLESKQGETGTVSGEVLLSVWMGTRNDEAFSDASHSDTGRYNTLTRSKVYLSPKLWYVRVTVIEAQDLQASGTPYRLPEVSVKIQSGFQIVRSRVAKRRSASPFWNEDLMLVGAEPFEDPLHVCVEDHQGPDKFEILGTTEILLDQVEQRVDDRQIASRWFNLQSCTNSSDINFQGRIHLRVCLEGGYHVMDEAAHLMSDMKPSAKQLWKAPIGVFELGILGAQNLLPIKNNGGQGTTDAYCVVKYGPKWVRTRTIVDSLSPRWNEQYTWEVYDACTVLTLCVFDNGDLDDTQQQVNNKHTRMGKVRVRLSTLEVERAYTVSYPLMVLQPGGLKKMGDIEQHEVLLAAAMKIVALRLAGSDPGLRPEVVQYVLDAEAALWSMRRSKANWCRISAMLAGIYTISTWMKDIRQWRSPITTLLVHVLFAILLCYPELILPTIFFYIFLIGLWQARSRSRSPLHIDPRLSQAEGADPDDLDEEFDTQPTSRPVHVIQQRYERLRGIAGRVQMVLGNIAGHGERLHGLLTWRDPRATGVFVFFCFGIAVALYIAPFKAAAFVMGIYFLRHPRFRGPLPSAAANFFERLPAQSDRIL
ncbi:hypothetical protein KP509_38G019300 [Ceratopteris richardii]|uniref:C2 domain-containing protein n=1 Tax=Ceratopteris richardii TaxID=49495 RepID=A0A8T2Q228_CERRI|nr:hypothetical protein KP509_38G019300 [Ceratopteris richardii]KAH7277997.1 hypothetical protein KP509_38G019300 [Ceratopteris richardii]